MKHNLKNVAVCPDCNGEVRFRKRPFLGQRLACSRCDVALVVTDLSPVELDWALDEDLEDEDTTVWPQAFDQTDSDYRYDDPY